MDEVKEVGRRLLRSVLSELNEGPLDVYTISEKLWEKGWGPIAAPLLMLQTPHFLITGGLVRRDEQRSKVYELTVDGVRALESGEILLQPVNPF